jgi:hypothetical protein
MPTTYYADGFDHYNTIAGFNSKAKAAPTSSGSISTTYKRTGTQTFRGANNYSAVRFPAVNNGNAIYVHQAIYNIGSAFLLTAAAANPSDQTYTDPLVRINADGSVEAMRGSVLSPTQLEITNTGKFIFNTWNHFITKFIIHDTMGEIVVKLNGETILNFTGDTRQQTNVTWTDAIFMPSGLDTYLDDLVIADTDLGDVRVITKYPDADSATHDAWSNSSGSDAYALLDETTPNDDTDYIYSSTSGQKSTWSFEAVGLTGTVKGVQLNLRAKKVNTGTRAIRGMSRVSSTDYEDTNTKYLPSDGYSQSRHVWENNPNTASAWAVSEIDASEFGVDVEV